MLTLAKSKQNIQTAHRKEAEIPACPDLRPGSLGLQPSPVKHREKMCLISDRNTGSFSGVNSIITLN